MNLFDPLQDPVDYCRIVLFITIWLKGKDQEKMEVERERSVTSVEKKVAGVCIMCPNYSFPIKPGKR